MSNSYSSRENDYHKIHDSCWKPVERGPRGLCAGGAITIWRASELRSYRTMAKRALKFYNKSKLKKFKLMEFYDINIRGGRYCYMNFRAQEDGSKERPLFRGVVKIAGRGKVLSCKIKDDDKIKLPADVDGNNARSEGSYESDDDDVSSDESDDDDVSSKGSYESVEDRPLSVRENDLGVDSSGVEHGSITAPDVGMNATSFQDSAAYKNNEERPAGIEIYEVVSSINGLTGIEIFLAVIKLMKDDVEHFRLLKALPYEKKREWVYFLINSKSE